VDPDGDVSMRTRRSHFAQAPVVQNPTEEEKSAYAQENARVPTAGTSEEEYVRTFHQEQDYEGLDPVYPEMVTKTEEELENSHFLESTFQWKDHWKGQ
jgi:hypothetical protein